METNTPEVLYQSNGITITPGYTLLRYKRLKMVLLHGAVASLSLGRKRAALWPYLIAVTGICLFFFEDYEVQLAGAGAIAVGALLAFLLFPRYALRVKLVSGEEHKLLQGKQKHCDAVFTLLQDCCAQAKPALSTRPGVTDSSFGIGH